MKNDLVEENIGLVYKMIKECHIYWKDDDEFQDYVSSGTIGLINGVRTYKEGNLSTYLCVCIKNELYRAVKRKNRQRVKNKLGDDYSLDYKLNGETPIVDTIIDERINFEEEIENKNYADYILNKVKGKTNKEILIKYFGLKGVIPIQQRELARIYKVSHQAIQQRIERILKNIRKEMKKDENN